MRKNAEAGEEDKQHGKLYPGHLLALGMQDSEISLCLCSETEDAALLLHLFWLLVHWQFSVPQSMYCIDKI